MNEIIHVGLYELGFFFARPENVLQTDLIYCAVHGFFRSTLTIP